MVEPPPDQRADVRGSIVFSRGGDIWVASGQELTQLTDANSSKTDSSPAWSPDGRQIYFIRTTKRPLAKARPGGAYTLYVTDLMRMTRMARSSRRSTTRSSARPAGTWFSHVLQPDVSADGPAIAVVSDGPDGNGPVELHLVNTRTGRMSKVGVPAQGDLGDNDPAFSPDGRKLAFTANHAQGDDGTPRIGILNCKSRRDCDRGRTRLLRLGYAHPSWSPDGRWIAAEATRGDGRDIVILDPSRGEVRVTLTNDGAQLRAGRLTCRRPGRLPAPRWRRHRRPRHGLSRSAIAAASHSWPTIPSPRTAISTASHRPTGSSPPRS